MKKNLHLPYLFLISILICSCSKEKSSKTTEKLTYKATVLPEDINKLFDVRGASSADTVWVFLQGGPDWKKNFELEPESTSGKDYDFFLDDLRVYPLQAQHFNSDLDKYTDFNYEYSVKENNTAAAAVKRVVEHFKDQNKIVYLIGHSYGAFMVQEILKQFGNIANANAILNCRLDLDELVWKGAQKGKAYKFDENGENPSEMSVPGEIDPLKARNLVIMASGLGTTRYTQALKDVDLSKTIFFGTSNDEAVGRWTEKEMDFLKSKSTKYFYNPGSHSFIFGYDNMKNLVSQLILLDKSE
jgi:pimeloyl-ACP methyl ester carboxylesterase